MTKQRNLWFILFFFLYSCNQSAFSVQLDSLLPDERNTIEVFQNTSAKVVYVHRLATVTNRALQKLHVPDGAGSGIIWDNKGHVVTNFHVIKGADDIAITIGKITVPAKIIGAEPRKDIAVLQIKSPQALSSLKSFTPFKVVHLNDLIVGQKAIAIGNPFGLDHSLSKGVISALDRQVPGVGGVTIHNVIQTDTPINPGNSGGPLLNSAGELIGLNTMIYSSSGSSAGIGFAVPAEDIQRIVTQIIDHGRVVLSGIGIQRVDSKLADRLGVKKGILIGDVLPNTPAYKAKLRGTHRNSWGHIVVGDVIVAVNAHPVENYDTFYHILSEMNVGQEIAVTIQRGNHQRDVKLKTIDIAAL